MDWQDPELTLYWSFTWSGVWLAKEIYCTADSPLSVLAIVSCEIHKTDCLFGLKNFNFIPFYLSLFAVLISKSTDVAWDVLQTPL